jgi:hypothetical protein
MRLSLMARFVSHPTIDFGASRAHGRRMRLGLNRVPLTYHRSTSRGARTSPIAALRPATSQFRFPSVGSVGSVSPRRAILPLGLPRARRA